MGDVAQADISDPVRLPEPAARALRILPIQRRHDRTGLIATVAFVVVVVVPTLLAAIYYGFVASPQYTSEARFTIRSAGVAGNGQSGSSAEPTQGSANRDAYVVVSFIRSPEILNRLKSRINLGFRDADWLSRLPDDPSTETLQRFFTKQVTTYVDGPSGIVTLTVQSFSPDHAQRLAQLILEESETLINGLSRHATEEGLKRAQAAVAAAEADYRGVLDRIRDMQNRSGILDPTKRASETEALAIDLMADKLDAQSRLSLLDAGNPANQARVASLKATIADLQSRIDQMRAQAAGTADRADTTLSKAIRLAAELDTDRMLSARALDSARSTLTSLQSDSLRKSAYIAQFVAPTLPDAPSYPHRLSSVILIALVLSIGWATCMLIWASIEDHRL